MRAYYCEANSDLTVPDTRQVPADSLAALGVKLWSCDVSDYEAELRKVAKENGFPADAALETFDATLYTGQPPERRFGDNYALPEDLVACVLSGECVFNVENPLGNDSSIIRIVMLAGDCGLFPAGLVRQSSIDERYKSAFITKGEPGFVGKRILIDELQDHPARKKFLNGIGHHDQ